ncbi:hypothetical protein ITI46_02690 [Streptomyces oryzae]|uniref:Uncharacterized protein n=1 Tax=Streptomyces oryzae TaxID=1434886 RepID=A0ABS3X5G5_9ACTN|nr:hypothetical protein [Streptomyces oryzae]MBO8190617.1 hypothetical protein [Streptomyces oryzae]
MGSSRVSSAGPSPSDLHAFSKIVTEPVADDGIDLIDEEMLMLAWPCDLFVYRSHGSVQELLGELVLGSVASAPPASCSVSGQLLGDP